MILRKRQIILYLEYQIIFLKKKKVMSSKQDFFFLIFIEDEM